MVPNNEVKSVTANITKKVPIYNVKTEENKVALTINCAWNADDIDLILKTLEEEKIKVTFFMVGEWVEKNKDAVKKISECGHEIGNHSDTHSHVVNLNKEENIRQIKKCGDKIKNITRKKYSII